MKTSESRFEFRATAPTMAALLVIVSRGIALLQAESGAARVLFADGGELLFGETREKPAQAERDPEVFPASASKPGARDEFSWDGFWARHPGEAMTWLTIRRLTGRSQAECRRAFEAAEAAGFAERLTRRTIRVLPPAERKGAAEARPEVHWPTALRPLEGLVIDHARVASLMGSTDTSEGATMMRKLVEQGLAEWAGAVTVKVLPHKPEPEAAPKKSRKELIRGFWPDFWARHPGESFTVTELVKRTKRTRPSVRQAVLVAAKVGVVERVSASRILVAGAKELAK